ncbi:MAG: hypothetical protein HGA76_05245 [Candidatus Firestonebacteria bacterium]|nr:hypothetical protein [Candidatus Firestonebacteria bacterium]
MPKTAAAEELRLLFNPGLEKAVCEKIEHVRQSLEIEMYDLSNKAVLHQMARAQQRGVVVRIILCPTQETNIKSAETLRQAGCDVRWFALNRPGRKMHLKTGIFDDRILLFGSPNWTYAGLTFNHEGLLVVSRLSTVHQARAQFESDWATATSVYPARLSDGAFGKR